jgi:ribosomal protein L30
LSHKPNAQRLILKGLGLRKIGHVVEVRDTSAIRGMVEKVQHLVNVEVLKGTAELFGLRHKKAPVAAPAKAVKPTAKTASTKPSTAQGALFAGDLSGATAVLGKKIKADDLKVVEGIGPQIEKLLHAGNITTWAALSGASHDALKAILDAAGPRYAMHDPKTWPKQAGLLAAQKWDEFKKLTDALDGGKE